MYCRMGTQLATGMMSGTSLDGMDLAHCAFTEKEGKWNYRLLHAETIPYTTEWRTRLKNAPMLDGRDLIRLHAEYGHLIGQQLIAFFARHGIADPGIIAVHGHTVFHRPDQGYTFQAGSAAAIAAETGRTIVGDFRSLDVSLQGQGAPLVPAGDRLLFGDYRYCLNLGGFANISYEMHARRLAHDICPLNIVMNHLASLVKPEEMPDGAGFSPPPYDPDGVIARSGNPAGDLLDTLNKHPFYSQKGPKSLGAEWVNSQIMPLLRESGLPARDLLNTWVEHAAMMIAGAIPGEESGSLLVSGGGTHNTYLLERIRAHLPAGIHLHVPDRLTVDYREALIFAFLGLLRVQGLPNCLASVTGSKKDHVGGSIFSP